MRSYYERVIYTFHHFLIQIQTDFRSQTCQRRYNHFYNSYFITSFLYSQRNIHGRQMDYYRSFLGLRFKRSVPLCRKNFYRQLSGGNAVLFSSLLSILLYTRNRIHNRYFKRILWIDYAKSICIYLVLLGHAHASQPVTDFIYTFHMPLFFFLSGCLFSFEKHPNFKEFAIKRFKGLMVPYLWINLITYLFWLFAGRNFGEDATISTTWYSPIIGILLGYSKQMIHNTPMWFFICLYFLEIFYYLLFKPLQKKSKSIKISVLIVIAVIGYTNYAYNPYTLPFCLGTAIVGMVFYGIGNLIVHNIQITKIKLLHIILVFLTMGIVIFIAHENGYIIMATNNYNNYILFFIGSFAGICMINLSSNFLSLKPVFQNIIIYISKNTLIINSFHLLTFSFLKGIMVFVFHIPVETLYGKIVPNIVFALVSLFSCLPIAYIINKHFPFIIGKKRSPEG